MRTQTLVAIDWEGIGLDVGPILAYLSDSDDAATGHVIEAQSHPRTQAPQIVHRITFDRDKVRGAHVHGVGYRAGFIVHLTD